MCSLILDLYLHLHIHTPEARVCASTHAHASTCVYTHYKKHEDIVVILSTCTEKVPSLNLSWGIAMTTEVHMVFLNPSKQM
jgi:hypothetical protein